MDTDRWARLEEIFSQAMKRAPEARASFLSEACKQDDELRERVESLIAHADTEDGITAAVRRAMGAEAEERSGLTGPGDEIGPYRIVKQLGQGGMGEVWLAEQSKPIQRRVALKVIKRGMDTRQVVARFEAERQALAMMDHPCVAKVHDGGATPGGRPFFVMEYVPGVPITDYCDSHRLSLSERLAVFRQVCEGVQHAHQRAIIHRDLKPSNVLVESVGDKHLPRIIDFGVAKATAQRLTEKTLFTEQGMLIGTPEYMSPEQAELTEEGIDTRTDVYALGVILYEILAGALPFDSRELRRAGFDGIRHKICNEEPPKPSTRISTLDEASSAESAKRRRTDPGSLKRRLKGDLDWIVMRALEKDRNRRYDSPRDLAADLERHLRHEPVSAGPPSVGYRAAKFVKRHMVGVAAGTAVLLALVAGIVGVAIMANVAERERAAAVEARDQAEKEAAKATAVTDFLTTTLWRANPRSGQKVDITVREALDLSSKELEESPPEDLEVEAAVRHTIGFAYRELGLYDESETHFRRVIAIQEELAGPQAYPAVRARHKLGALFAARGDEAAAEEILQRAVADYKALLPTAEGEARELLEADLADALSEWGSMLTNAGKARQAIAVFEELGELDKRIHGEDHDNYAIGLHNLAILYDTIGEYDEEERIEKQAFAIFAANHPEERAEYAYFLDTLGVLALKKRDVEEAESYNRRSLELRTKFLGEEHTLTAFAMANVAEGLQLEGRFDDAREFFLKAIGIQARTQGERSRKVAYELNRLGRLEQEAGNLQEAEGHYENAISMLTAQDGAIQPNAAAYVQNLGTVQESRDRLSEAERSYREALRIRRESLPEGNPGIQESLMSLGRLLLRMGRPGEAEPLFLECREAEKGRPPSAYYPPSGAEEAYREARRAQGLS
jgi:serine/threonine protein kinase/tetratricopeptide (TPR) repeat protein